MKPIKLKFYGLNSFISPQELDFSELSKGVFGIFGKTGSGKTTILDAIMLALYGQISKTTKAVDFINSKSDEAFVYLTFDVGDKEKNIYFIERKYRKKRDGTTTAHAWFGKLIGDDRTYLAEGVRDVDAKIKEIVGLTFNEFSKCMALPQGEFAGFLNATSAERTEIISNIFSLQEYGDKLIEKVKVKYGEMETQRQVLEAQKAMLSPVTEKDISDTEKTIEEKKLEIDALAEKQKDVSQKYHEMKVSIEKTRKKLELVEELQELYKKRGEYLEKTNINERQKRALTISGSVKRVEELTSSINELKSFVMGLLKKKNEAQNLYSEFLGYNEDFDKGYQNNLIALTKRETALIGAVEDEMQILSLKTNLVEIEELVADYTEKIQFFDSQLQVYDNVLNDIKEQCVSLQNEIKELEDNKALQISLRQIQDVELKIEIYNTLECKVEALINKNKEDLKVEEINYSKVLDKEKAINEELKSLNTTIDNIYVDNEKDNELDELKEELLKILETEHKIDFIQELVEKRNENIKSESKKVRDLEEERGKLYQELESINKDISSLEDGVNKIQLQKYRDKLLVRKHEVDGEILSITEGVDFFKREVESLLNLKSKLYLKFVDNNNSKEDNFKGLKDELEAKIEKYNVALGVGFKNRVKLFEIQKSKVECGTKILMIKEQQETNMKLLSELQSLRAEQEFLIVNTKEGLSGQNVDSKISIEENLKQKNILLKEVLLRQSENVEKRTEILLKMQQVEVDLKSVKEKMDNLLLQIQVKESNYLKVMQGEINASKALRETRAKITDLTERFEYNSEKKEKLRRDVEKSIQEYNLNSCILDRQVAELSEISFELNGKIFDLGFKDIDQIKEYLIPESQMLELEAEISNYKQLVALKESQLKVISEELSDVSVDEYEYKKLENEIENISQKLLEEQVLLGTLISSLNKMRFEYKKLIEIESELPTVQMIIDDAKELLSLLRGKALVEFLAEEYLIEITKNANSKLNMLLGGRYELEFENNDFIVYDNFNDHKPRVVQTLSGGETFLVSLSLALAISETISYSSNKSMEFFFLDEGFGTLDSELIESVISALYKLEGHNLKIGLISHVKELEEEIKNKVLVEKATETDGSSLRVVHML